MYACTHMYKPEYSWMSENEINIVNQEIITWTYS